MQLDMSRPAGTEAVSRALDLSGGWLCALDHDDTGEREGWPRGPLPDTAVAIDLPGSLQHQGLGDPVSVDTPWTGGIVDRAYFTDAKYAPYRKGTDVSVPFWLQPHHYYRGNAWFQREIEVPSDWNGSPVELTLERVHWESTVWIDGNRVGAERSLTTAHRFDLGRLSAGRHLLIVRVDNRTIVDVGPNSHSISDHTQGNWNGIIGDLTLRARPEVGIRRVRTFPDLEAASVRVAVDIASSSLGAGTGTVTGSARRADIPGSPVIGPVSVSYDEAYDEDLAHRGIRSGNAWVDLVLPLGPDAAEWSEFDPAHYELTVALDADVHGHRHHDAHTTVFGLREISARGGSLQLNGRPIFLRGTLESCVFPLTGYPATDVSSWRRTFETCISYGLNHVRFHSWCPPEAAFRAADELGVYLQIEGPIWANQGAAIGLGGPLDEYLYEETRRILDAYGNHPSFLLMSHGNEPAGRDREFLGAWVDATRAYDPRRLYTSAAGWPAIDQSDFDNLPEPRSHAWDEGLSSRMNGLPPATVADYSEWVDKRQAPIVSHEIGQWCAYPDFDEIDRYLGLMQPKNLEIFRDFLAAAGMADQAGEFLAASGSLQTLCYKEEIESALRTTGFGGFQLLGLSDFPGQGTALVGVLNAFWESKGYCPPEKFARFCGPTVPLARLPRRMWAASESATFDIQLAHFGPAPMRADVSWELRDQNGRVRYSRLVLRHGDIAIGNALRLDGEVIPAGMAAGPEQLTLVIIVTSEQGDTFENDWSVWIYPAFTEPPAESDIVVTSDPEDAIAAADAGYDVLLDVHEREHPGNIALGFTTVFWNTAWTSGQAPHTLGLLHDPQHPAFARFPSGGSTDWQWWESLQGAKAMVLDGLPADVRPVVQPIDTWFEARRLGAIVEGRLGDARIVVSSLNLDAAPDRLAATQLRSSLLAYMRSDAFDPPVTLEPDHVRALAGLPLEAHECFGGE
jgi:hypothetical protein